MSNTYADLFAFTTVNAGWNGKKLRVNGNASAFWASRGSLGIPLLSVPVPKILCGVDVGTWGFLPNADMDLGVLLESPQGSQSSARVGAWTWAFLPSCSSSVVDVSSSKKLSWFFKIRLIFPLSAPKVFIPPSFDCLPGVFSRTETWANVGSGEQRKRVWYLVTKWMNKSEFHLPIFFHSSLIIHSLSFPATFMMEKKAREI